ncbi:CBO0543 family protein [Cytobacillus firmus]|uniref:CBO0543 family protein n=1 Tax=Cytobacillus firmus TaxID=1399 RepID=UPI0024C20719|nr:CBO0543 family protein [Cytobacillus firmus]WHY59871.1 CBO0543 family protein [Cytobacillus firmus]
MQTSFVVLFIIVSLLFGAWKRLSEFYPTLLFWIIGDLLYASLLHDFRVWEFRPVWIDHYILPTHTIIATAIAFLIYPSVIVMYLGRFPKTTFRRMCWVVFWALIFEGIELIAYINKSIIHQYGWTLAYSFLFNLVTFSLLPIHKWKPWAAWVLAFISILFLWIIFDPPLPK